jgi:serine/threonine protein phosphatase PrpC
MVTTMMPGAPDTRAPGAGDVVALLSVGAAMDLGNRATQEDAMSVMVPESDEQAKRGSLFVLADGLGGHNAGEVASRLAVQVIQSAFYASPMRQPGNLLQSAIEQANRRLFNAGQEPALRGLGSTCVCAVVQGDSLWVANVGDSRAYLMRPSTGMAQLSQDHSLAAEQVRQGIVTAADAANGALHSVLLQSLGMASPVEPHFGGPVRLQKGDLVLLCSDGLYGALDNRAMQDYLSAALSSSVSVNADQLAHALVEGARFRGADDNVSALVIHCVDVAPEAVARANGWPQQQARSLLLPAAGAAADRGVDGETLAPQAPGDTPPTTQAPAPGDAGPLAPPALTARPAPTPAVYAHATVKPLTMAALMLGLAMLGVLIAGWLVAAFVQPRLLVPIFLAMGFIALPTGGLLLVSHPWRLTPDGQPLAPPATKATPAARPTPPGVAPDSAGAPAPAAGPEFAPGAPSPTFAPPTASPAFTAPAAGPPFPAPAPDGGYGATLGPSRGLDWSGDSPAGEIHRGLADPVGGLIGRLLPGRRPGSRDRGLPAPPAGDAAATDYVNQAMGAALARARQQWTFNLLLAASTASLVIGGCILTVINWLVGDTAALDAFFGPGVGLLGILGWLITKPSAQLNRAGNQISLLTIVWTNYAQELRACTRLTDPAGAAACAQHVGAEAVQYFNQIVGGLKD